MSAELLAEFGDMRPSIQEDEKVMQPSNRMSLEQQETSNSAFSDVFSRSSLQTHSSHAPEDSSWHQDNSGAEVLFSAFTEGAASDDEFGDFENADQVERPKEQYGTTRDTWLTETAVPAGTQAQSLLDVAGGLELAQFSKNVGINHPQSEWEDFAPTTIHNQPKQRDSGISPRPIGSIKVPLVDENADEGAWAAFEDGDDAHKSVDTQKPRVFALQTDSGVETQSAEQSAGPTSTARVSVVPKSDELRPSNIPPPAVLLQILPIVFDNLASILKARQTEDAVKAILQAYLVACRIIAGRSVRWKRDNILSQSMKIGPAAAGRKGGGMKLAALDKSESIKEEREVAEILKVWEEHAHFFNSTVKRSGARRPLMVVAEKMRPRLAKGEGVIVSQHACALCGLKRDERVLESDINIEDSFGEFWADHWGHRDCKDFWSNNQVLLPLR